VRVAQKFRESRGRCSGSRNTGRRLAQFPVLGGPTERRKPEAPSEKKERGRWRVEGGGSREASHQLGS
jgi:hypothetical protein